MIDIPIDDRRGDPSGTLRAVRAPLAAAWAASALCLVIGVAMVLVGSLLPNPYSMGRAWGAFLGWEDAAAWLRDALIAIGGATLTAGAFGAVGTVAVRAWVGTIDDRSA